jgi:O-antigen/teichoic acid export membrane protein
MGSDPENDPASELGDPDALAHVRRFARGSMILLSSGIVSYVGALVLTILLARVIGKEAFGAWAIGFATAQLLSTVGLIGADWIVLRQGSYYESVGDAARFRRTIHVALGLSGAGLFLLGDAAVNRNLLQPVIRVVFVALALAFARSASSAYVALVVAEIVLAVAAAWVLNRRIPLFGRTERVNGWGLVGFAVPAWLTRLAGQGRAQLFPVLLGSLASIASSGVFVVTTRISLAPTAVVNAMNQVYTPIGSDLYLHGRRAELAELYKSTTKWMFTLAFPLVALMAAFPAPLLSLFGTGFRGGDAALVVLAVGVLFQFGTGPVTVTLILIGRPRLALLDYVFVVVLEIVLAVWLIPSHGLLGAAIAKAVGTALNNVVPLIQVWSITGAHPFRVDFWKPVVAGVVAFGAAKLVSGFTGVSGGIQAVLLAGAIVGIVYLALILVFGLEDQDRAIVHGLFRRRRGDPGRADAIETPAEPFDGSL